MKGIIMGVNGVNFKSNLNPYAPVDTNAQQRFPMTEPYPSDTFEKKDNKNKNKKIIAGVLGAAAAIGLGILALRRGHKPSGATTNGIKSEIENLTKNAQKVTNEVENTAKEVQEKAARELQEKAAREVQEKAAREAQEKAAREAQEKAAREAQEKAAREAQEKAAREAQEKAAREAQEKAAREAQEKAAKEVQEKAAREAQEKAMKDLEALSNDIPNMSRSAIAQQRHELNRWGCEIDKLEMKAKKEGLTELENVRLDFLKQKLSLLEERERQIAQSLEKYVPTASENSAVSMHHNINGENTPIREAIRNKAKNPSELSELQIKNIQQMEKRMAKIDSEFAQLPPLEKDCIVYRGRAEHPIYKRYNGDFEIMEKAKVGDVVIPDTGYSYTAFNYDIANNWCQGGRMTDMNNNPLRTIMYEIRLPKGAKVSRNLEHYGEVVMPRSAQYKVLDKKVGENGDIEAILEYIIPKA